MPDRTETAEVRIVPANEATGEDLQAVFGTRGDSSRCWRQRYKMRAPRIVGIVGPEDLAFRLREQTDCDQPRSESTSGLVAYLEHAGWCVVQPRSHYVRLLRNTRVLGSRSALAAAGFTEVSHPTLRRVVMRIDL